MKLMYWLLVCASCLACLAQRVIEDRDTEDVLSNTETELMAWNDDTGYVRSLVQQNNMVQQPYITCHVLNALARHPEAVDDPASQAANDNLTCEKELGHFLADVERNISIMKEKMEKLERKINAKPKSCLEVPRGVPRVRLSLEDGTEALCDTITDGGGWRVIQRRVNGLENFYRPWKDYKFGFGSLDGDFWTGLETLHELTKEDYYEMRVDIMRKDKKFGFAQYTYFRIENETKAYKLILGDFYGTIGDELGPHRNMKFSTRDQKNDNILKKTASCAIKFRGAWWFDRCHKSHLNGVWGSTAFGSGVTWKAFTGFNESAIFAEMKIRPVGFG
ncbi:unnamed protein product [Lymnaea stagnalis]|uniref:Fibrinogen C-terminal domain-containing protein n=1 Tax=Lymnaea stagnalis TaxID=6523 RepID=A0AAV2HTV8_LYMST